MRKSPQEGSPVMGWGACVLGRPSLDVNSFGLPLWRSAPLIESLSFCLVLDLGGFSHCSSVSSSSLCPPDALAVWAAAPRPGLPFCAPAE